MQSKNFDRRSFLKTLGLSSLGIFSSALFFKSNPAAALELCDKLDPKSPGANMVKILKYVPESKKTGQKCENCIQFKQDGTNKKLGQCTIFQNCSVNAGGWCSSWSKKS